MGLGPRVPLYVILPWSRGGWVNSQVFDHTSIEKFLENLRYHGPRDQSLASWSVWRSDLAFDFSRPSEASFS